MTAVFRNEAKKSAFSRAAALVAAAAFVLQALTAAVAAANAASGGQAWLPVYCAPQTDSAPAGGDAPASPPGHRHHDGACCVLHSNAFAAPAAKPDFAPAKSTSEPAAAPFAAFAADAVGADPELSPLSARAPPAHAA
jgi:hypothetical protein